MKRILTILAAILTLGSTFAGPLSPEKAAALARHFWHTTLHQTATLQPACGKDWAYPSILLFTSPEGGFVLVSADDNAKPILGYSEKGALDPDNLPVQLQEWLAVYQQEIHWASRNVKQITDTPAKSHLKQQRSVAPLLSTLWDQYQPYNALCPSGTVTGCAATAQAQLMKFWNFPAFGNGSHSYLHNRFGTLSADFAHTLYDWDHMPDSADAFASSQRQINAVATLMFHIGVSLDMLYNSPQAGGSAAAGLAGIPGYASMDNSLKDYFFYNPSMRVITKAQGFTDDSWRDTLMAELDLGHPILYTGSSPQGGHGFVCDGYDTLGFLHFNFGWSGEGDGYYAIGAITPGIGPDGSHIECNFSSNNQALLGAVPVYTIRLSDTTKAFLREGGSDSLLLALNSTLDDSSWTLSCDADWLTVTHDSINPVGWIHISASENTTGTQRTATIHFRQGNETATLRVVQDHYSVSDYCPVTVVMESRRGNGWLGGAHLTLQSEGGLVYGTAQLAGGSLDSLVIPVPPQPLRAVWHSGGGTDRFVNYTLIGPDGNELLHVENAYLSDDRFLLPSPCSSLGLRPQISNLKPLVYPNPASEYVDIVSDTPIHQILILDLSGRQLHSSFPSAASCRIPIHHYPAGLYLLRVITTQGTATQTIHFTK
ncbi:MAG: C10 family peptidase [Bacteroidales bacterium]|nr:C10 family peptidase [Bacteroidales bacterium]